MKQLLSKESFVNIMKDLQNVESYHSKLNQFFKSQDVDGYLFQPDCSCSVIELLKFIFDDQDGLIDYFCFEAEFGRKWKAGCFKDRQGRDLDLSAAEPLYEALAALRQDPETADCFPDKP